ncbi:MAG TPA: chloride channel protein [Nitrososphaerales archaeon]|nr:chloride channel protein [Nitrososphaerales archaeon]
MAKKETKHSASIALLLNRSYLTKWVVIGLLIGLVAGFGAVIFYYMIQAVSNYLLGGLTGFYPPNPAGEPAAPAIINPRYLYIPISTAVGGLIAGLIIYKFAPEAEGHGTDAAIDAFHNKGGYIRRRVPIVKTIASSFTIGSGGSAGREGPTAQIAAGFGSFIGEVFKLSAKDRRIALAAGIGAGIGSIFKSPFGGAILSAEILYKGPDIEAEALIPAFIASPIGYVIFASFTGFTPVFGYTVHYAFSQPLNLFIYAFLGVLCAGVGRLYTLTFYSMKRVFQRLRITNYVKPMIGGALAGVIGIFFPEVVGLGYGFLQFPIDGNLSLVTTNFFTIPLALTITLIVLFKILATSITVGSGGSGGVFAPALVIGGFLGSLVWVIANTAFPGLIPIPAPLVVIGMMALFAGVGRVPIAVILMVSEMTGTLQLLVPSMVAVVISYYLTGPNYSIYKSQVLSRADSPAHRGEYNVPIMSKLKVADAANMDVKTLKPEDVAEKAFQLMNDGKFRGVPIVSDERKVLGIVTMNDIFRVPGEKTRTTSLKEIMTRNVITADPDENLFEALSKMTTHEIGRLPVVEPKRGELVGILTRTDLFKLYNKKVQESLEAER